MGSATGGLWERLGGRKEAGWTKGREVVGEQNRCHHTNPAKGSLPLGQTAVSQGDGRHGACVCLPVQLCLRACVSVYTCVYPVSVSDWVLPGCLCVCE